jgi:putative membrane-bound dehydrogenase-like protein
MNSLALRISTLIAVVILTLPLVGQQAPKTGPETEKRFPPLKVPAGFKATLFACDPLIEYPSVIAAGPKVNQIFQAQDYYAGLGNQTTRKSEVRLLEDTDGDGYADKSTVFATGFNSIQGLAYHDGTVFVMHAPFLTALRDTKCTGKADERKDLLSGLGIPPEKNRSLLHCANGVVVGQDGWLYLSMGDNGVDVPRPEGDRLVMQGGGILRCRPDGRDLHVFATGLRNVYDLALDEELNVLLRDNENDGGTYMIRYAHSFFGADHGYPYLYMDHPDEALAPLADLGLGSSAGGACYLETAFPADFRGNIYFCEWGRSVMRCRLERSGSSFAPVKEIEFAAGGTGDPYGFKPTDIVVQRDGSMYVSDWADGQQPKRGRGRIYRITYTGDKNPTDKPKPGLQGTGLADRIAQLDSDSYYIRSDAQVAIERQGAEGLKAVRDALAKKRLGVRGRLHAVWIIAHLNQSSAVAELFELAKTDADAAVQAQAIRAIGDLSDPVLIKHRIDVGIGDAELAARLAALARGRDPRVLRETIIVMGRLGWNETPTWLPTVGQAFELDRKTGKPDQPLAHAAMQSLRRSRNWSAILKLIGEPESEPLRAIALRALAERFEPAVVDGLVERLRTAKNNAGRLAYADMLSRVWKKPGPWVYWGYSPRKRPANTVAWDRTEAVELALNDVLGDPDKGTRLAVLKLMQQNKIATRLEKVRQWLQEETDTNRVAAILSALSDHPADKVRDVLVQTIRSKEHASANRLVALNLLVTGLDGGSESQLLELARTLEDGLVLAEAMRQTGKRPKLQATPLLLGKLASADASVRAAAVDALADLQANEAREPVQRLLEDKDAQVRRAGAAAAGKLGVRAAIEPLLKLARDAEPAVRQASFQSLRQLKEPRVVPLAVAALNDRAVELEALTCIGELGGPEQVGPVTELAQRSPSAEVLTAAIRVLTGWRERDKLTEAQRQGLDRAVAGVQGHSGVLMRWQTAGPMSAIKAGDFVQRWPSPLTKTTEKPELASGTESRLKLTGPADTPAEAVWLAFTEADVSQDTTVEFLGSSNGKMQVWLNGKSVHQREQTRSFQLDSDRFPATLAKGTNRLLVQVSAIKGTGDFHLRFRRKSSTAEHEKLTQVALTRKGDVERGRKLFLDAEKSQCIKCHRMGDVGEKIGPELTGVGSRFSPIYIVESILEPSRTIAPSFETLVVVLKNGKIMTGVKVVETDTELTIADNQGQKHMIAKADIDERQVSPTSTMPDGLEKKFTPEEFSDLIAFLVSQKETRGR